MSNGLVKIEAYVDQIRYPKASSHEGGYTIATFRQEPGNNFVKLKDRSGAISVKGDMIRLKRNIKYTLLLKEGETHPQFGTTYEVMSMARAFDFTKATPEEVKKFLSTLMTEDQLDAYYEVHGEDPIKPFLQEDTKMLEQVKGIGEVYSALIMQRYLETKDFSEAYIRLARYNLDPSVIKLILSANGGDPDLAEEEILKNPYQFMLSLGLDFATCDRMYAVDGGQFDSDLRLEAIMTYVLIQSANEGDTWRTPLEVCQPVRQFIPNIDMKRLGQLLVDSELFFVSEDRQRVSLVKYVELEKRVVRKIIKLQKNSREKDMTYFNEKIEEVQNEQGWRFSPQQREAIELMIQNNVFLLEGYGGTGKTTIIKTVLDLMPEEYAVQCALSGKASDNLAKVTGRPGFTIKRLVMTSLIDGSKLPHTIVVIDEFAMVDLELLDELLSCTGDNIKLIMVGDCEQLEAIGIPVMKQLIETGEIPYMMLTEIHRQAEKSAVITDSIKIRNGEQFLLPHEQTGKFVHGELEDLHLHLCESDGQIVQRVVNIFEEKIKTETIDDVQIIAQTRAMAEVINDSCKQIYNPIDFGKAQSEIIKEMKEPESSEAFYMYKQKYNYINIRGKKEKFVSVGDKVINTKNNYDTFKVDELSKTPIFNGNTGIIRDILEHDDFGKVMHIEFDGIGLIVVPQDIWTAIDLAYCITVHKSQGSSCKVIIAAIISHKFLNTRQLLYTAITRVREEGHVVSTRDALTHAVLNYTASSRRTYITGHYLECLEEYDQWVDEIEEPEEELFE